MVATCHRVEADVEEATEVEALPVPHEEAALRVFPITQWMLHPEEDEDGHEGARMQ